MGSAGRRWDDIDDPVSNYARLCEQRHLDVLNRLAARLSAIAEAGQLLVGPETLRRLNHRYHVEQLSREHLKNPNNAVDIYRVLGA